jgi:hypothetical protein
MKLISLALLLFVGAAHGACPVVPSNVACVQWQPSAGWTNNTPFAPGTVVTYTVWLVSTTTATSVATTTGTDATIHGLKSGNRCFVVTASALPLPDPTYKNPSVDSNQSCKQIRFPGPTDGKIEGPTDGAIEPK